MPSIAPYGSWKSPITPLIATLSAAGSQQMGFIHRLGGWLLWLEPRPAERGRLVIMGVDLAAPSEPRVITPPGFNVRNAVEEYGGGPFWTDDTTIFFTNFDDQRLYRQSLDGAPTPITPEPPMRWGLRYADGCVTPDGRWVLCVRERHHPREEGREADTELVVIPADGSAEPRIVASGRSFYSNVRVSRDGRRLSWLCWDHPNMPWDGSEVWIADLAGDGSLSSPRKVAGGPDESIFQPEWTPEPGPAGAGALIYSSDRTGWWNLYRWQDGRETALTGGPINIGDACWQMGYSVQAHLSGGRMGCIVGSAEGDHVCILGTDGALTPLPLDYRSFYFPALASDGDDTLYFVAGGPTRSSVIAGYTVSAGALTVYRQQIDLPVDRAYLAEPYPISFPTTGGDIAHAMVYPPTNPDFQAPPGEKPPLLVQSHGGPTASLPMYLKLQYQYYTSRGFAVVDVAYRGSTGFGREYWKKLYGWWGVRDVEDCIAAAEYLVGQGLADPNRLAISGGSAGGYCTLCALTFHSTFQVGSSWYGIGDMETMVADTHKFESRYCDMVVANTYPAPRELLRERSPIHYTDRLHVPMILFQGLEDKIVLPNQAEDMARALDAKGLPYALLMFEGEEHTFRRRETIVRCLEAELTFFSKIFKFEPADPAEPVEIHNLGQG